MMLGDLKRTLLGEADEMACQGVSRGKGGPFGAVLAVYIPEDQSLIRIAANHNRVLETGLPSAHAEDQVITEQSVAALEQTLQDYRDKNPLVLFASSGQSCSNCQTKEEILARRLLAKDLIKPGNFHVFYGADYETTKNVAGFDDLAYDIDIRKPESNRLIQVTPKKVEDLRSLHQPLFDHDFGQPMAIVLTHDETWIGTGREGDREKHPLGTAENLAIQAACARQKNRETKTPFDLRGGILVTTTREIGPLAYATCQWANIAAIWTLQDDRLKLAQTAESPGIANTALFEALRAPADSVLSIEHMKKGFENLAQIAWRDRLEAERKAGKRTVAVYNGVSVPPHLLPQRTPG